VEHPRKGVLKVSAADYVPEKHGLILNVYESDGSEILVDDGQSRTTPLP
jgi:hypothetical protein